jgi:DNA polymerase
MLIGEAPGRQEDKQGRPFVGPSGKYLDRMMDKAGLTRKNLYITSSVKCRPPKNRTPAAEELDICKKNWLDRQMALINPKIIVLLGRVSLNQVLGIKKSLKDIHGQTFEKDARTFLPTYHPAAAMRFPKVKQRLTRDLKKLSQKPK